MKSKAKSFFKSKLKDLGNYFKKKKDKVKKVTKVTPPKTTRKAPTKSDDMARAKQYKGKTNTKDLAKKTTKNNKVKKFVTGTGLVGTAGYLMSKAGGDKPGALPKKRPSTIKGKNFGMGMVDSLSKAKVKQGPPKPSSSAKTKKKSSFMGDLKNAIKETKRNFGPGRMKSANERNLDSKGNYKGTNIKPTKLQLSRMKKPKKNTMANTTGPELMQKKKKNNKAPMYEMRGTMGGVKKAKYAMSGGKMAKYKAGGGKMKTSKYYAGGGMVFTGR